jgi:hypothetical protein
VEVLERKTCSLEQALECENEDAIIEGFMERYNVTQAEAKDIFHETKKWLWVAAEAAEEEMSLAIDKPLQVIDEMWHNFILYTRSYHMYCMEKFRRFIHHEPTPKAEKDKFQSELMKKPSEVIRRERERQQKQLSFLYDKLGAETLVKWYEELPTKYNEKYLASIKK